MTRKERKRERRLKKQPFLTAEQRHKLALLLLERMNQLPKQKKFCNQTFITENGEHGCFPFGGYHKDVCLCKFCWAKLFCSKEKARHKIKLNDWRVCNEKGRHQKRGG